MDIFARFQGVENWSYLYFSRKRRSYRVQVDLSISLYSGIELKFLLLNYYVVELNPVSTCRLIASLNLDELKEEETGQLLKDFCEPHKSLSRLMTPALKVVWHHFLDAIGHAAVQCTLLGGAVAKKGTATTTSERGQRQASLIYCVEWKYFQRNFPLLPSMSKKVKKRNQNTSQKFTTFGNSSKIAFHAKM